MSLPRTLPIRLAPLPGEALDSWLEAYAHRLDTSLAELYAAIGLHTPSRVQVALPSYTVALHDHETDSLAVATGVPADRLHAATLRAYHGHAVLLNLQRREVRRVYLWGRGRGSRFCPQCLQQSGGRWRLRWRLAWSFACIRHGQLLADACPRCGRTPRNKRIMINRIPVPWRCAERSADADGHTRCGHPLTHTPAITLDPDSPVLAAQRWIDQRLTAIESQQLDTDALRGTFDDLRALAGRALLTAHPHDADTYGPAMAERWRAVIEQEGVSSRSGTWPPTSAVVTAVALGTAVTVLSDRPGWKDAVRQLIDRDHARGFVRAPLDYHTQIGATSFELRRRVRKALDSEYAVTDRLRYRTMLKTPREPSHQPPLFHRRASRLPQQLWAGWTLRLLPAHRFRYDYFRHVLAAAVLLVGNTERRINEVKRLLGNPADLELGNPISRLGQHKPVDAVLRTLCALADYLDNTADGIDYQHRRELVGPGLLPASAWTSICRELDLETRHSDRHQVARRYLYHRLTGTHLAAAPAGLRVTHDAWSRYKLGIDRLINERLMGRLDDYAAEYLSTRGIADEPVVWEPQVDLIDAELLVLDTLQQEIRAAHQVMATGATTIGQVATAIEGTAERARLLLQHHPPAVNLRMPVPFGNSARVRRGLNQAQLAQLANGQATIEEIAQHASVSPAVVMHAARQANIVTGAVGHPDEVANITRTTTQLRQAAIGICRKGSPRLDIRGRDLGEVVRNLSRSEHGQSLLQLFELTMGFPSIQAGAEYLGLTEVKLRATIVNLERAARCKLYNRAKNNRAMHPNPAGEHLLKLIQASRNTTRR